MMSFIWRKKCLFYLLNHFYRDLGSSLQFLSVLWMARCGLEDLGGLSTMNNLSELYLAFNEISDIGPCSMLEKLQTLDLEGSVYMFFKIIINIRKKEMSSTRLIISTPPPTHNICSPVFKYRLFF